MRLKRQSWGSSWQSSSDPPSYNQGGVGLPPSPPKPTQKYDSFPAPREYGFGKAAPPALPPPQPRYAAQPPALAPNQYGEAKAAPPPPPPRYDSQKAAPPAPAYGGQQKAPPPPTPAYNPAPPAPEPCTGKYIFYQLMMENLFYSLCMCFKYQLKVSFRGCSGDSHGSKVRFLPAS